MKKLIKKNKEKFSGVVIALFILGGLASLFIPTLSNVGLAFANRHEDQLEEIEREIESSEAEAEHFHQAAATLSDAVKEIEGEVSSLERQIKRSSLEKRELEGKIKETERQIVRNQGMLGSTISDLYVDDSMTPIEMLASSNSIGDYVDKQEYRNAVRDQVAVAISTIKELRAELEKKNNEVKEVLARQKSQEGQLLSKRNEKKKLLAETQGQERKYRKRVSDLQAEREQTMAAIEEAMRAAASSGGSVGGNFQLASMGQVSSGDIIGRVGSTGFSTGCHLHFEVWVGGSKVDPMSHLGGMHRPSGAAINQGFGDNFAYGGGMAYGPGGHPGIDFADPCGSPVFAAASGTLERGWLGSYGCAAIIDHGNGMSTLYGHFSGDSC